MPKTDAPFDELAAALDAPMTPGLLWTMSKRNEQYPLSVGASVGIFTVRYQAAHHRHGWQISHYNGPPIGTVNSAAEAVALVEKAQLAYVATNSRHYEYTQALHRICKASLDALNESIGAQP